MPERNLMFVLHHHDDNDRALFSEVATGLDHIGLAVTTRSELDSWQQHLAANGVTLVDEASKPLTQSPIVDAPYASVLVFRDAQRNAGRSIDSQARSPLATRPHQLAPCKPARATLRVDQPCP